MMDGVCDFGTVLGFAWFWGRATAGHPVWESVGPLRVAQDPCHGRPHVIFLDLTSTSLVHDKRR